MLDEAGVATLDLNTASSLLLDMLDVCASVTYDLRSQIEALNRLKINRYPLFRPFALGKR